MDNFVDDLRILLFLITSPVKREKGNGWRRTRKQPGRVKAGWNQYHSIIITRIKF